MNISALGDLGWAEWASAATVLVVGLVLARLVSRSCRRLLGRTAASQAIAVLVGRIVTYVIVVITIMLTLNVLELDIGPLIGALGLSGLVVALAFQDIAENIVAGVLIHVRRPFVIGDEIETGGHVGHVIDVNARTVVIDVYTGERVFVPNSEVIGDAIINRTTHPLRRLDLSIGVAYDTDLEIARQVIDDAVTPVSAAEKPAEVHLVGFGDSSIDFVAFVWHGATISEEHRVTSEAILAVKAALDEADITIPFPQRSVWFENTPTGRQGAP